MRLHRTMNTRAIIFLRVLSWFRMLGKPEALASCSLSIKYLFTNLGLSVIMKICSLSQRRLNPNDTLRTERFTSLDLIQQMSVLASDDGESSSALVHHEYKLIPSELEYAQDAISVNHYSSTLLLPCCLCSTSRKRQTQLGTQSSLRSNIVQVSPGQKLQQLPHQVHSY